MPPIDHSDHPASARTADLPTPTAPWLQPATAATIDTPALVVDLDRLTAAIDGMATAMAARGVALRPHAKTHKSLEIGRRQIAAGARGLTVGTLGEAEVFAAGGLDDLFVAYPVIATGPKAERLDVIASRARLRLGLDSVTGARALVAALGGASRTGGTGGSPSGASRADVLVEIDTGGRRTGVLPDDAGPLAAEAAALGLRVVGVFTHAGHGYASPSARAGAADDEASGLERAAESLARVGVAPLVVSAGSTPTAVASARGAVTEERPGTYVLGDRQQVALGSIAPDAVAAGIVSTVVSVDRVARRYTVDAGAKVLGKDTASYLAGHGVIPALGDAAVTRVNDYHGIVEARPDAGLPEVGDVVVVVPNHICPVVNLVDAFLVVRDGRLGDTWPVDARGRNG